MDFEREWTIFAAEAEYEYCGMSRLVAAHNRLRYENEQLRAEVACYGVANCPNVEQPADCAAEIIEQGD